MSSQTLHAGGASIFAGPLLCCSPSRPQPLAAINSKTKPVPVISHSVRQCYKTTVDLRFAVTDMFYEAPYSVQAEDEACVMQFGVHSQYNWAAYK